MKKPRRIALEWGLTHRLLDALGIGKHKAALHVRMHQLLRQLTGAIQSVPSPKPDKLVAFDDEPTKRPPGMGLLPRRSKKKRR
jgi:hypothetical protein